WKERKERLHTYFTPGTPKTQMQLSFSNHYNLFEQLFFKESRGKSLEVGCGRGNLSLYFAHNGWETTLLDNSSKTLRVAEENFKSCDFKGQFVKGDANRLPFEDKTFDTTFSVGLFEHFRDAEKAVREQFRVLKKNGVFIGYVVPSRKFNVQSLAKPLNVFLSMFKSFIDPGVDKFKKDKDLLYRNTLSSGHYMKIMSELPFSKKGSFGIFPVPSISYSEIYPFTPLPRIMESSVVALQKAVLGTRGIFMKHPWRCTEFWGQAFVVWGIK
ncbi:MAG: class I SAM-dependent methyltransferase, partial [bacterium]